MELYELCWYVDVHLCIVLYCTTTFAYLGENSSAISTDLSIITTAIDKQTLLLSLMIENVTKQQEGFYTCYGDNGISNVINSSQSSSVEVVVQGVLSNEI